MESGVLLLELRPASAAVAAGKLTCFGGKRELGESASQCLLRELEEELGWAPDIAKPSRAIDLYVNGKLIAFFYELDAPRRDENLHLEAGTGVVWLSAADALRDERLSDWHATVLRAWQQGKRRADFGAYDHAGGLSGACLA